ncbi:MAG: hypothetical protein ABSG01_15925 [Anaerolineales bacterium]|jgi:hypothetical protein
MRSKELIKDFLGDLPFTAEIYWLLRHRDRKIRSRFNLEALAVRLPGMVAQVTPYMNSAAPGKKIFIFASLHFWINHAVVTGMVLCGLGHKVTLGYLPYGYYDKPINRFDLRRHELYARHILKTSYPVLKTASFLDMDATCQLPKALYRAIEEVTRVDTQYILQKEDVTEKEPIYLFRLERNLDVARKALAYFDKNRPDVVIVPNGMIQEFGAVYETARYLDILTVTYEFFEMDQRILIAQNDLVMLHPTDELWQAYQGRKLNDEQLAWLNSFLAARQGIASAGNAKFAHLYQKASREGKKKIYSLLKLDDRPIVLMPTNVLGDTATLGRTRSLFSNSMAEWILRTVKFFIKHPEVQLVIRLHPAESHTIGLSVAETIHQVFPELPENIHIVGSQEKINTYDLVEITDLALVYTTTAGLEMATRGIPVLLSGSAHYREKGFTLDADGWNEYFQKLEMALMNLPAQRLKPDQIDRAWNYAYFYFHDYPRPFPWHLEKIWPSLEKRPISYVLGPEGRAQYEATFQELAGAPMNGK